MNEETTQRYDSNEIQTLSVASTSTENKLKRIDFKNLPDTTTPLNAEALEELQDNFEEAIGDEKIFNSIFEEV